MNTNARGLPTWVLRIALLLLAAPASMVAAGCAPAEDLAPAPEVAGGLGVRLAAVLASCSGQGFGGSITSADLVVTVTGPDESGDIVELTSGSGSVSLNGSGFAVGDVPVGADRVVTVSGSLSDGTPVFSRTRGIAVAAKQVIALDMLLVRSGDFGCLEVPAEFGNTLFPAVAPLPDGRILVAGGFRSVTGQGGTSVVTGASDKVYIFDGRLGTFQAVPEVMPQGGRGAAAAVFLPSKRQVVIFGGARELRYDPGQARFPFSFLGTDALSTYDVLSVDALERRLSDPTDTTPIFQPLTTDPATGQPNRMLHPRVFPRAVRLELDDAILVTGGGAWPRDASAAYLDAEYYHPQAFDGKGGFVDPQGSLVLNTPRAGHSFTSLGLTADGFSSALLWGGTNDGSVIGEVFQQGSSSGTQLNGVFIPVVVTGDVPPPPYFHAAAAISSTRTLIVGGVEPIQGGALSGGGQPRAYVLDHGVQDGTHTIKVTNVGGLDASRYFGALGLSGDGRWATVVGGWTNDSGSPATSVLVADLSAPTIGFQPTAATFEGRGGIGAAIIGSTDVLFLVGGIADPTNFNATAVGAAETFVPVELTK